MKNKFSRKSLLLVSMTVILATVINLFAGVVAFAAEDTTTYTIEAVPFSQGQGTEEDPYLISVPGHLVQIGTSGLDKHYKLMNNIDLSTVENNTKKYAAWTPLGDDGNPFAGTFDGNGHTISGFSISYAYKFTGFFAKVEGGTVKNLTLADATLNLVAANFRAGVFAGVAGKGSISGCKTESTVNVICNVTLFSNDNSVDVGGIVGYLAGCDITYCENNAKITVENCKTSNGNNGACTGGIVGHLYGGTISYCVNNGPVTLKDYVNKKGNGCTAAGGIVGNQNVKWDNTGTVEYCINNGAVSDLTGTNSQTWNASAGGIAGTIKLESGTSNTKNCYNFGSITVGTSNQNVGGQIVGYYVAKDGTNITKNYGTSEIGAKYGGGSDKAAITTPNFEIKSEAELKASDGYKAIATEVAEHLTGVSTDLYGYQTTKKTDDNKFDMRLVATLSGDISKCVNVGFRVSVTYKLNGADQKKAPENNITVTTLYEAITATDGAGAEDNTKTHTAASLGGDYIFVLACKDLPAAATDIAFTVTTFYTGANGEVYSETETFGITVPEDTLPELAA